MLLKPSLLANCVRSPKQVDKFQNGDNCSQRALYGTAYVNFTVKFVELLQQINSEFSTREKARSPVQRAQLPHGNLWLWREQSLNPQLPLKPNSDSTARRRPKLRFSGSSENGRLREGDTLEA